MALLLLKPSSRKHIGAQVSHYHPILLTSSDYVLYTTDTTASLDRGRSDRVVLLRSLPFSIQPITRLIAVFSEEVLWNTACAMGVLTAYWPRAFSEAFEVGLDIVNLFVS